MITIRKAKHEEWHTIAAFQEKMAKETEGIQLDRQTLEKGIKAVFSDPSKGCYYIAEINQEIAGSLMITYEWSDWRNKTVCWIQSVYVRPEHRRKGVYRHLYDHIKKNAQSEENIGGIRLYVDKSNNAAQQTYTQLGMNGNHYQLFEWMKAF